MKKSLLSGLFLLLCCAAWGQKRTVDPVRNDYVYVVRFDRIETTKERTVAEVTLRNDPASWIRYDTGCYLRERGGDRRYRLLAAEGFELGKEVFLPAPGVSKARFVSNRWMRMCVASIFSADRNRSKIRTAFG